MKRLLIFSSALFLAAVAARPQAFINANNSGSGVFIMVSDPAITSSPVAIGTPAEAAGFLGLGPEQVSFSLYAAVNGTALSSLESAANLVGTGHNVSGNFLGTQGYEDFLNPLILPSLPGFDGSVPLEFIMLGVSANGQYQGWSAEATGIVPTVSPNIPVTIFGSAPNQINSFVLTDSALPPVVPEPASFAIAGLGAAALALFRRRKN